MNAMERRVRDSFAAQDYMATIGAELVSVKPGAVDAPRSRVVRSGRRLSVCASDVFAVAGGKETRVATLLGTIAHKGGGIE